MKGEPWLKQWMPKIEASPRGVAFDIGANAGDWSELFAGLFAKVVSLEPDERCQPPAGMTYDRRAVWSESGEETLYRRTSALQTSLLPVHDIGDNGASVVTITAADGREASETIPVGPQLLVAVGDEVEAGAALTNDPNVGGFGQLDTEVVLQNPVRIYGLLAFFAAVALAQIMLVLKKKQVEKVQAAEGV